MSNKKRRLAHAGAGAPGAVKNFWFNTETPGKSSNFGFDKKNSDKNLRNYISPVQLQRLRTDVALWREAIAEAEKAYYPFRVKMQRIFIDTILNGHVYSVMERRKDLTLMRKYKFAVAGGEENKEVRDYFNKAAWFSTFIEYALDALFFGYSLISIGDIVADNVKEVGLVPRWFVSPDREEVGSYIYSPSGKSFREEPQAAWHIYVKTKSDTGVSPAGYGLLYQVALYEIFLRNTLGYNGDYVELYAMPYRVGKTTKTTENERSELEAAVRNMGSAGWAIIDPMDEIEFLESKLAGTGYKSYESLEKRCQQTVSKILLGHADAMDSTPGKLGAGQNEDNPIAVAMAEKASKDGAFIENVINNELLPRLRNLGITIPENIAFSFLNDKEVNDEKEKRTDRNAKVATLAKTMKDAGLKMSAEYFTEETGIPVEEIEEPAPLAPGQLEPDEDDLAKKSPAVKNRLIELYSKL